MKTKTILYIIVVITATLLTAYSVKPESANGLEPKINIRFEMRALTVEEYSASNTRRFKNAKQASFQKGILQIRIDYPRRASKPEFRTPNLQEMFKDRYVDGKMYEEAPEAKNTGIVYDEAVIYTNGLDEDDLRERIKNYSVSVKWETRNGTRTTSFNIADYLIMN